MFRIITGVVVLGIGLWLLLLAMHTTWIFLFHGSIASAIGIAILLNKKEDEIEDINEPKE